MSGMTRQLTITHPPIFTVALSCMLSGPPAFAQQVDDQLTFDQKSLLELVAAMPAIEVARAADLDTGSIAVDRSPGLRMFDRKSAPLAAALYALMLIDTQSTFASAQWCPRCVETNPYAAPFIRAGRPAAFGAGVAFDTGVMYLAHRMRQSWNPAIRKIWFVLPVGLAVGHAMAIHHNYRGIAGK